MRKISKLIILSLVLLSAIPAGAIESVGSDSRIRTFVYGKNDVFRIISTYGYQTVVEFEKDERIITISVGNPNIFKIIPSQNRLFLKALQNGQLTNVTVITDRRSYQMEFSSIMENPDDMMYLVRFVYPEYIEGDELESDSTAVNQPMQLYSPVDLPRGAVAPTSGFSSNLTAGFSPIDVQAPMGAIPSASNLEMPISASEFRESVQGGIRNAQDGNAPLSMQYNSAGTR